MISFVFKRLDGSACTNSVVDLAIIILMKIFLQVATGVIIIILKTKDLKLSCHYCYYFYSINDLSIVFYPASS